jgi:hypothetical protein
LTAAPSARDTWERAKVALAHRPVSDTAKRRSARSGYMKKVYLAYLLLAIIVAMLLVAALVPGGA